jgi:hypothetical protein
MGRAAVSLPADPLHATRPARRSAAPGCRALLSTAIAFALGLGGNGLRAQADSGAADALRYIDLSLPDTARQALQRGQRANPAALRAELRPRKQQLIAALDLKVVRDFDHLPLLLVELAEPEQERAILARPGVERVWPIPQLRAQSLTATQSANQMQAGQAEAAGFNGAGTSVLVTDTALSSGPPAVIHSDFGPCTAVGVPASCQLRSWQTLQPGGSDSHGSNVSAIVARTARGAGIHFADIGIACADGDRCVDSVSAFTALNWAVQNQAQYNIVAHNMSWGSVPTEQQPCSRASGVFQTAKSAGIVQVAAAGNDSGFGNVAIMRWPSCNPYVVGVGSLDTETATWTVSSFSNSESVLSFLAPGRNIDAGGYIKTGTSMASPHVAGAVAVLRAGNAWSGISIDALISQMRTQGRWIVDSRTGQSFPMPMMYDARPIRLTVDNRFAAAYSLSPPPMQGCGSDCYHYARNAVAGIGVSDPALSVLNCDAGMAPCTASMYGNRVITLMPTGVLAAVITTLQAPASAGAGIDLFGDGFE